MAGENLCFSYMEVASEQWTERNDFQVDFNGDSTVIRKTILMAAAGVL